MIKVLFYSQNDKKYRFIHKIVKYGFKRTTRVKLLYGTSTSIMYTFPITCKYNSLNVEEMAKIFTCTTLKNHEKRQIGSFNISQFSAYK